ncbi:WD40 repeat domain-containing protein, partial [Streptomyces sp. NPDC127108]|uniref:WD40 repeat domain-containing protein n=1 Tax=Streptomyces sp. NPDC127108 TaxID=3345361 RepID=UPI0036321585
TSYVEAVVFSANGRMLATSDNDISVRLWDTATGKLRRTLIGQGNAVVFSPDGRTLATSSRDGKVRLWDGAMPTPAESIRKLCRAVHRDFTLQERSVYFPDLPPRPACPS